MGWVTSEGVNTTHLMPGPRGPKPALNSEQIAYLVSLAGEGAKKPVTRDKTMLEGLIWELKSPTPSYMMPTGKKGNAHVFIGLVSCHSFIYFDRLTELVAERGP